MAQKLVNLGADTICIKDMAGLLTPGASFDLVTKIRQKITLPIHPLA